jgi:hypothetical protein
MKTRAPYNAAHFLEVQSFREGRPGRDGEKCKETANLFRRLRIAVGAEMVAVRRMDAPLNENL